MTDQRTSIARKLALSLFVVVVLALLVEAAARVRQRVKFGTFGRVQELTLDPTTGLEIPVPGRDTGAIQINSLGFRGDENELPKPPERVRIAFIGGSTTFCAEASSNAATWPAVTHRLLAEALPGCSLDFVNAGVPGYTLEQSRINLEQRVSPLEPDVIVFYEATNDLTRDTRTLAQAQGVCTEHADRDSWLSRISLTWYLIEKNLVLRERQASATTEIGRVQFDARELSKGFEQRLRTFVEAARQRAKVVALVTFSIHARPEQSPDEQLAACNTSLYYMPYMTPALLLEGFAEYNRVVREVARDSGALLIEAADRIPGDSVHFNDSVHFKDAGCERMARLVADGLLASGRLEPLCRR